jgi:hypothetical protein
MGDEPYNGKSSDAEKFESELENLQLYAGRKLFFTH